MDLRKEQKEELAQLAHVSESKSQGEESVTRLPERRNLSVPETGRNSKYLDSLWLAYSPCHQFVGKLFIRHRRSIMTKLFPQGWEQTTAI